MIRLLCAALMALSIGAHAGTKEAIATATTAPECVSIAPFYWEVGNSQGKVVGRSVGIGYGAKTTMSIASASKWVYGAYVVQRGLPQSEQPYLTMRSGYTKFGTCTRRQSVAQCAAAGTNGVLDTATVGLFDYDSGHMQQHASKFAGLGALNAGTLASTINAKLGTDISYSQPQLAGGGVWHASGYAAFLRSMMTGRLEMGNRLSDAAVCTKCSTAIYSPAPDAWHYAIGHWIEDDPQTGDGAFSSAGTFGFYPWISADLRTYGVLARQGPSGAGVSSALCGRLIRKAYLTP